MRTVSALNLLQIARNKSSKVSLEKRLASAFTVTTQTCPGESYQVETVHLWLTWIGLYLSGANSWAQYLIREYEKCDEIIFMGHAKNVKYTMDLQVIKFYNANPFRRRGSAYPLEAAACVGCGRTLLPSAHFLSLPPTDSACCLLPAYC